MMTSLSDRPYWRTLTVLEILGACLFWPANPVGATVFDWDNFSGNSDFSFENNWRPVASGAPPKAGDTALFDGQLENAGIGNNTVNVPDGTAINDIQIFNSLGFPATVVDLSIGDGTTSSQFDLDQTSGNSLVVGNSFGDTATLNLLGGCLDTWGTTVGGQATFNVVGEGSEWDVVAVLVSGDTIANTAGIGLTNQANIWSGSLDVGSDTGSGRVVVDGTVIGFGTSSRWTVVGSVDIGPTSTTGFNFGHVTLQDGGRMSVSSDVDIHGADVNSTLTVQTGGDLDVTVSLNIGQNGRLELFDPTSTITTGDIDNNGGTLDWTGGTLHITTGRLRIDDSAFADLGISSLTVGAGKSLIVSLANPVRHNTLVIGDLGNGVLAVVGDGTVQSFRGSIGEAGIANGSVTVSDPGSSWTVSDQLRIGDTDSSVGQLSVLNQGEVTAELIWLGGFGSADGTLRVADAGSSVTSNMTLSVGGATTAGGTGRLTVENGGAVQVGTVLRNFGGGTVERLDVFSPFTADFDLDGDVDGDDLAQWQGDFGTGGGSDADADGDSDGGDFLTWQRQFGSGVPSLASSQTVPEPATGALAAAALLGLILLSGHRTFVERTDHEQFNSESGQS